MSLRKLQGAYPSAPRTRLKARTVGSTLLTIVGFSLSKTQWILTLLQDRIYVKSFQNQHPKIFYGLAEGIGPSAFIVGIIWLAGTIWRAIDTLAPARLAAGTIPSSQEPQPTVAPASPEIPDDQVIQALLERLPPNQWQLLLDLSLGEKVYPLDEPGLEDLERNKLAQRLRKVTANTYLFRVHPENTARVNAFYGATVISASPSHTPPVSAADAQILHQINAPFIRAWNMAHALVPSLFTLKRRKEPTHGWATLVEQLLDSFVLPQADMAVKELNRLMFDSTRLTSAPVATVLKMFHDAINGYVYVCRYIWQIEELYLGSGDAVRATAEYHSLFEVHLALRSAVERLEYRTDDLGQIARHLPALRELMPKPLSDDD